jgi:hypothetical protein
VSDKKMCIIHDEELKNITKEVDSLKKLIIGNGDGKGIAYKIERHGIYLKFNNILSMLIFSSLVALVLKVFFGI